MDFGYTLLCEQTPARQLVTDAVAAEQTGMFAEALEIIRTLFGGGTSTTGGRTSPSTRPSSTTCPTGRFRRRWRRPGGDRPRWPVNTATR